MYLAGRSRRVLALEHSQQTLVYANVLLLRLHHPHSLLPHGINNPKNIHIIRNKYLLQYPVQGNERPTATHPRTAVHHNWTLIGSHSLPERTYKTRQRLRRTWHTKVRPRCKVEVLDHAIDVIL